MHAGITFRQIETFYWIARLGSFSEAAQSLNATQPAVSNRIRELESILKVTLFARNGRGVQLTPAGRDLLGLAEQFVELGHEFLARARSDTGVTGVIRIGAADTVALTWLPRLVAELSRRYPRLVVELFVDLSMHIQSKLAEGDLDVGFLVGSAPSPEFVEVPLGLTRNVWMAAPQFGLHDREVTTAELAEYPVLTHSRGSHLYWVVKQWFADAGVKRIRIHGCSSLATMIEMTLAGLGVSLLPPIMIQERYGNRLKIVKTDRSIPPTRFSCLYSGQAPNAVYSTIIEIARREMERERCFESLAPEAPL